MSTYYSAEITSRITTDLYATQKPYRILHIFGVLQTCISLGALNGVDCEKLTTAALLHDCAKHIGREETLRLAQHGSITLKPEDQDYPAIWHGHVGAWLAQAKYGIDDSEILDAVRNHTLGSENPSKILQILMCADYCEPTRSLPNAEELRRLIRKDLRKGLLVVLNRKVEELIQSDKKPHPGIYKTISYLEN